MRTRQSGTGNWNEPVPTKGRATGLARTVKGGACRERGRVAPHPVAARVEGMCLKRLIFRNRGEELEGKKAEQSEGTFEATERETKRARKMKGKRVSVCEGARREKRADGGTGGKGGWFWPEGKNGGYDNLGQVIQRQRWDSWVDRKSEWLAICQHEEYPNPRW